MKKTLFFIFMLCSLILNAKQVSINEALKVVSTQQQQQNSVRIRSTYQIQLVETVKILDDNRTKSTNGDTNLYYVFNIGNNNGFVIVAADDISTPIIGYSNTGCYDSQNLPDNFAEWMSMVEKGISNAIHKQAEPTQLVKQAWQDYLSGNTAIDTASEQSPLVATEWNQSQPYFGSIPVKGPNGETAYTGCVATAMAQILKYYNYPKQPFKNIESYKTETLGFTIPLLSPIVFDWENMTNKYLYFGNTKAAEKAVADLMYYCGASVNMDYNYIGGSAAFTNRVSTALIETFGYDAMMQNVSRKFFTKEDWDKTLKQSIDSKAPIYFSGSGPSGGHAFICDGYDAKGLFHFNWGWGGYKDGYYSLDAPLEYTNYQNVILNIKPGNGLAQVAQAELTHGELEFSTNRHSIHVGEYIVLKSILWNSMIFTKEFKGEYKIELIDESGKLIYTIKEPTKLELGAFSGRFMSETFVLPEINTGKYQIKLSYKNNEQHVWNPIMGDGSEFGAVDITVVTGTGIQTIFPPITTQQISINIDAKTLKSGDLVQLRGFALNWTVGMPFEGSYKIVLTDLDDNIVYSFSSVNLSLAIGGYKYLSENITIPTLPLGDYKLTLYYKNNGKSEWSKADPSSSNQVSDVAVTIVNNTGEKSNFNLTNKGLKAFINNEELVVLGITLPADIWLYTLSGKQVQQITTRSSGETINVSSLQPGIYIVKIITADNRVCTAKVIKK